MTKLPTTTKKGAVAALISLDEGIARLRFATGRSERRVLSVVCSVHGKGFSFVCERIDPQGRFKISKPEKISSGSAPVSRARPSEAAKSETFNPDDFDFDNADRSCPWCGSAAGWVIHSQCATTYCGGARTTAGAGSEHFACPACNVSFGLSKATAIYGNSAATERPQVGRSSGLIGQAKRPLLPK